MYNIKNIIRKSAIAIAALALALCCALSATAAAIGNADAVREPGLTVASLDRIADGYDAAASGVIFEIEIP